MYIMEHHVDLYIYIVLCPALRQQRYPLHIQEPGSKHYYLGDYRRDSCSTRSHYK